MTYERFEDLPVWKKAAELYDTVEAILEDATFRASRGFRDQLDRAALSVSNNIAEGFERGSTNELLQFIYIARGSAGEVRSMLRVLARRVRDSDLEGRINLLTGIAESCSRQLRGWADSLQNSEIKGQRHLNQKSRDQYERDKRADAFRKRLLLNLPPNHPLRKDAEERGFL
jgi:four helix bundle protein